jgi:hypothetical protein
MGCEGLIIKGLTCKYVEKFRESVKKGFMMLGSIEILRFNECTNFPYEEHRLLVYKNPGRT